EAWLRRIAPGAARAATVDGRDLDRLFEVTVATTRQPTSSDNAPTIVYRCQATELSRASEGLRTLDPRPYWREFNVGNVSFGTFVRVSASALFVEPLRKLGLWRTQPLPGSQPNPPRLPSLNLQPGDLVQVKSAGEIAA